jgi:hypothetical protein
MRNEPDNENFLGTGTDNQMVQLTPKILAVTDYLFTRYRSHFVAIVFPSTTFFVMATVIAHVYRSDEEYPKLLSLSLLYSES